MVLKNIILSIVSVFLILGNTLYNVNQKRADKVLGKLWLESEIDLSRIEVSKGQLEQLNLSDVEVYSIQSNRKKVGYAYFADAPSKVDNFTYMVIFDLNLKIHHTEVLKYRENYGSEICSKRFLKQFVGKSNGEGLIFNKDIDGVSGATISSKSITFGVRKLSKNIFKLKEAKLL